MAFLIYKAGREWLVQNIEIIKEVKSNYQTIIIADTPYGKALILDNYIQFAEHDEHIFHKNFAFPVLEKNDVKSAIVLGGGDLLLASYLKMKIDDVKVVELDEKVVEICKTYFSHKIRDDIDIIIGDALKYRGKADVVYVDLIDSSHNKSLYNKASIEHYKSLSNDCVVMHSSVEEAYQTFYWPKRLFKNSIFYTAYIPSFKSLWVFGVFSDYELELDNIWKISYEELKDYEMEWDDILCYDEECIKNVIYQKQ